MPRRYAESLSELDERTRHIQPMSLIPRSRFRPSRGQIADYCEEHPDDGGEVVDAATEAFIDRLLNGRSR